MKLLANADQRVAARRNAIRVLLDEHPDNAELRELVLGRAADKDGWRYPCGVVIGTLVDAKMIDPHQVGEAQLRHFRSSYRLLRTDTP
jgi:hypothetical protein